MQRRITISAIFLVAVIGGLSSRLRIENSGSSPVFSFYGSGENYRESGFFELNRITGSRWMRDVNLMTSIAVFGPNQAGDKIRGEGFSLNNTSLTRSCSLWDGSNQQRVIIELKFDYDLRSVTLLNTGESLRYSPDMVCAVIVDDNYKIKEFLMLSELDEMEQVDEHVADDFKRFFSNQR